MICRCIGLCRPLLLDRIQVDANVVCRQCDIVIRLQLHPVGGSIVEIPRQTHSGVCSYRAFAQNDFINAPGWNLNGACKLILAQVSALKKLRIECLTGMVPCHVATITKSGM